MTARRDQVQFLAKFVRGSHLYGLNTPQSDLDYGGLYAATTVRDVLGFARDTRAKRTIATTKEDCELDEAYYELRHFVNLLERTNTQVIEALFAPDSMVLLTTPVFDRMRKHRMRLIDTQNLAKSLHGYLQAEQRLVFGEVTGKLGGKRQQAVATYGFSPKNAVQYIRLAYCGTRMLMFGEYPVDLKSDNPQLWKKLMELKTQPENFTKEKVAEHMLVYSAAFETADRFPQVKLQFDNELADDLLLETYLPHLNKLALDQLVDHF